MGFKTTEKRPHQVGRLRVSGSDRERRGRAGGVSRSRVSRSDWTLARRRAFLVASLDQPQMASTQKWHTRFALRLGNCQMRNPGTV